MSYLPERILLATDGSEDAVRASRTAAELARRLGAELHVVHVGLEWHLFTHDYINPKQYERLKEERQKVLDEQVAEIEARGGRVTKAHLRMGRRVDEEVIDLAREIGAELIVVGSRGLGPLSRAVLGSDSNNIVHHAHCPVLVVRREDGAEPTGD
ncbi:Universal stress protein UspA-related nucleotide-binding protein (plasmid) [Rubrobacter radiotolerans]|nr:Universal stress protein UspA-related nucleotide-binding protein [Rubrobacter radiotolerans]SMC01572.1 Nucleotide-binding universal stress protein, UspA family [Rubrobacter radiotolerans DSM 5868]